MALDGSPPLYLGFTNSLNRNIRVEILGSTGSYELRTASTAASKNPLPTTMLDFLGYSHTLPPTASAPIDFALDFYNDNTPAAGLGSFGLIWTNYIACAPGAEPTQIWIQESVNGLPYVDTIGLVYAPTTESHTIVRACAFDTYQFRSYYKNSAGQSGFSSISSLQVGFC